jgi:hypothetical protein
MSLLTAIKAKKTSARRKDEATEHYVGDKFPTAVVEALAVMFDVPKPINYTVLGNRIVRYAIEKKEVEVLVQTVQQSF